MIADLDSDPRERLDGYDLVIVGSGPAGATLVRELEGSGLRLCVLESGRSRPTARGDALRASESEGIFVKEWSRERVLGGASTTWAGLSAPFDAIDFEPRDWPDHIGWPFGLDVLEPYYARAAARYRFPTADAFGPSGLAALRAKGDLQPPWQQLEEKVFLAADPPQNFAREQRDALQREDVEVWLDATVLELESGSAGRVRAAQVRTRSGATRRVEGRAFVLCAGGLENARLLLLSRDACTQGLGNEHDQVGRYLMNHPKNYFGKLVLTEPVESAPYFFGCLWEGFAGYAGLRLPAAQQREEGLVNSYVRLEPLFPWTDSPGVEAMVTIAKRSQTLLKVVTRRKSGEVVELRDYSETGDDSEMQNARKTSAGWLKLGWTLVADTPRVSRYLFHRLSRARPKIRAARVRNFMEMEPCAENRLVLGSAQDANGRPVPRVLHAPTARDRRSMVAVHEAFARDVEQAGVGRLESPLTHESDPWPIDQDASHHMGATRMGRDPRTSVVDPDARVHGVENLWVAGASVLPTSGCANPTFTLVALAIRLAEHLRTTLDAPEADRV